MVGFDRSASAAIQAAGGSCGDGTRVQSRLFGRECYRAVLENEAGNTHRAVAFGRLEGGMRVAEFQKSLEIPHVAADVDDFVAVVSFDLFLYIGAVGA